MEWKYDICSLIVTMSNVSWSNGICNENCTISYCIIHIDYVKFHFIDRNIVADQSKWS